MRDFYPHHSRHIRACMWGGQGCPAPTPSCIMPKKRHTPKCPLSCPLKSPLQCPAPCACVIAPCGGRGSVCWGCYSLGVCGFRLGRHRTIFSPSSGVTEPLCCECQLYTGSGDRRGPGGCC
uniref:Uncharacterized protein n=1 Tax=Spermophilus dauricus TaxID=99837 RepID=A0A8C9NZ10_SPEDA